MKLPSYPKLKPSGIEWLGDVPEHWPVDRLKWTTTALRNGIWGEDPDGTQNDIACIRVADFDRTKFRVTFDAPTFRAIPSKDRHDRLLRNGNLLLEKSGGGEKQSVGCVVQFDHEGEAVSSNFVARIEVAACSHSRFTTYLHAHLYSRGVNTRSIKQTTGIQNLDSEAYLNERVTFPSLPEQQAIADFLDREARRIDTLIEKKQRQIELLAEKRTALISHAVTRGLDPSAKLKPSGIEWLGDVPEYWDVKRLKFIVSEPLKYGANEAAELDDPTLPRYIRITDVDEAGRLRNETFKSIPEVEAKPYLLKEGDLLLARSGATVGKSFYYESSWGRAAYAGYLIRARFNPSKVMPRFVNYFTNSRQYWQWLSSSFIQSTIQNVSADKYASLMVTLPAYEEQKRIIVFLDRETARIDALTGKVEQSIELLHEYRTALISAAVTGKIDVRKEVA